MKPHGETTRGTVWILFERWPHEPVARARYVWREKPTLESVRSKFAALSSGEFWIYWTEGIDAALPDLMEGKTVRFHPQTDPDPEVTLREVEEGEPL